MNAAIYARYSSDNQRAESIAAQFRFARDYCKQKGYAIVKEYKDEAMTGTNDNRPAFQQMLKDAALGLFEVVVMHKVDRAARNEYDYYTNRHKLEICGVRVEYAGTAFDTSTPEGRFMEAQLVGMAAYYSRNLSNEIKKGQRENLYEGKCTNGSLCFGYKTNAEKYIVIDENKAPAVRYIFEEYAKGTPYRVIKAWLRDHGFKTARGNDFTSVTLHDILVNPRYKGTAILGRNRKYPNGKRNSHRPLEDAEYTLENAVPAIVSKATWERVQIRMEKNRHNKHGSTMAHEPYLLTGLIFCGACGSSLTGTVVKKGHSDYRKRYYRCNRKLRYGTEVCPNKMIGADALEKIVIEKLEKVMLSEKFLDRIVKKVQSAYTQIVDSSKEELAMLEPKAKKLRKSMDMIYALIEDGAADEYDIQRLRGVQSQLHIIEAKIKEVTVKRDVSTVTEKDVRKFIKEKYVPFIKKYSAENNFRAIIEELIDRIEVDVNNVTIHYKLACGWCDWCDSNARPAA